MKTNKRKGEHIEICLSEDVESNTSGSWDEIRFVHYSLPEMDFEKIRLETVFLEKKLGAPFMITAITGGFDKAEKINKDLAIACEQEGIALGVGSQRAMIESRELTKTFVVRDVAPNIFLCGNIGVVQLKEFPLEKIEAAVDAIEADALCIHLNPLQEAVQDEGDRNWGECLNAIERACDKLYIPVIVKETGAGINAEVAKELERAGVKAIDVSGAGGTSWSLVESYRGNEALGEAFLDWGISTVDSLKECRSSVELPLIASGGIRNGLDAAKAIRLGASVAGGALPFIKAQAREGPEGVRKEIQIWKKGLRTAMFLTRSRTLKELCKARLQAKSQAP